MATFFDLVERIINAVYGTPNPQVQTYFRDLRVTAAPPMEEDDDSNYAYKPEPNVEHGFPETVGAPSGTVSPVKLSPRNSGAVPTAVVPSQ